MRLLKLDRLASFVLSRGDSAVRSHIFRRCRLVRGCRRESSEKRQRRFLLPQSDLHPKQRVELLQRLNDKAYAGGLVVSNARELFYQVIVYTPSRAW